MRWPEIFPATGLHFLPGASIRSAGIFVSNLFERYWQVKRRYSTVRGPDDDPGEMKHSSTGGDLFIYVDNYSLLMVVIIFTRLFSGTASKYPPTDPTIDYIKMNQLNKQRYLQHSYVKPLLSIFTERFPYSFLSALFPPVGGLSPPTMTAFPSPAKLDQPIQPEAKWSREQVHGQRFDRWEPLKASCVLLILLSEPEAYRGPLMPPTAMTAIQVQPTRFASSEDDWVAGR
ncbi:uncharacterized protein RAG0_10185 [Rhynchosporium agropyri]|uniref:Uncharacterized protein n=1 Tax=Rhynchosporium agropyri TaxID=914238 RepID=A0A1E1KYU9_9HELO|nr:uncharacterized protein RAG0_10185 [Rhynchosporium agropyri]